jgi:hypothetical protein
MLSAKDSTIMPDKDQDGRPLFPQRAQARGLAFRIRECDIGEFAAIGFGHAGHSHWVLLALSREMLARRNFAQIEFKPYHG